MSPLKTLAASLAAVGLSVSAAAANEISFQGKTISLIINSTAGGGTDTAARLTGNALAKYLPGNPTIIYRNLPGGGGLKANNYFLVRLRL